MPPLCALCESQLTFPCRSAGQGASTTFIPIKLLINNESDKLQDKLFKVLEWGFTFPAKMAEACSHPQRRRARRAAPQGGRVSLSD